METTSLVALSRQMTLRRQMEIVANNIASVNTTAFKGEKMMFRHEQVKSRGGESAFGDRIAFVRDIATVRDLTEGTFQNTGNPLDVALHGDGYFVTQSPDGERYTRNGHFRLDPAGQLVNDQGYPALSSAGQPIFFSVEDREITIARDGTVSTENGELGRLRVVTFDDEQALKPLGGGLYSTDQAPRDVERPDVVQGTLEGSNVEPVIELARMIEISRAYESVKNLIDREDERLRKVAREIVGTEA